MSHGRRPAPVDRRPHAVVHATLVRDHQPVFSDDRPHLSIGQTNEAGERAKAVPPRRVRFVARLAG